MHTVLRENLASTAMSTRTVNTNHFCKLQVHSHEWNLSYLFLIKRRDRRHWWGYMAYWQPQSDGNLEVWNQIIIFCGREKKCDNELCSLQILAISKLLKSTKLNLEHQQCPTHKSSEKLAMRSHLNLYSENRIIYGQCRGVGKDRLYRSIFLCLLHPRHNGHTSITPEC